MAIETVGEEGRKEGDREGRRAELEHKETSGRRLLLPRLSKRTGSHKTVTTAQDDTDKAKRRVHHTP